MNPFLETDFGLLWGPLQVLLLIVSTEIEMTEVVKMRKISRTPLALSQYFRPQLAPNQKIFLIIYSIMTI